MATRSLIGIKLNDNIVKLGKARITMKRFNSKHYNSTRMGDPN